MSSPSLITIPTLLMLLFTLVLYLFLNIVRREIIIAAKKRQLTIYLSIGVSVVLFVLYLISSNSLDDWLNGLGAVLIVLSFIFEKRGLAADHFVTNPLSKSGIAYESVSKITLQEVPEFSEVRLYIFYHGIRGPVLRFSNSMEELLEFLNQHLKQDTEVEVIMTD